MSRKEDSLAESQQVTPLLRVLAQVSASPLLILAVQLGKQWRMVKTLGLCAHRKAGWSARFPAAPSSSHCSHVGSKTTADLSLPLSLCNSTFQINKTNLKNKL